MKLYKTKTGILIEHESKFYLTNENWDLFVKDDDLLKKTEQLIY